MVKTDDLHMNITCRYHCQAEERQGRNLLPKRDTQAQKQQLTCPRSHCKLLEDMGLTSSGTWSGVVLEVSQREEDSWELSPVPSQ